MAAPRRFGRYEILERLGRGGMGVVYRAYDPYLGRDVAIKVLAGDLLIDDDARARFHREGRALAALPHPGIVTILDVGEQDQTPYIVTEFLRGADLARLMRESPLSLSEKLHVIGGLCDGLAAAHDAGIVHCDIKPANIWLQPNGCVKVLDFGIARGSLGVQTRGSGGMGSPHYMAPEQLSGSEVDARADVFAVGVVMYELLTGCKPFSGDTPTAVMFQILSVDPPDLATLEPGLPQPLVHLVSRALQKSRERRFQTVRALKAALDDIVSEGHSQGVIVTVPATGAIYVEPELARKEIAPQRSYRRFVPLAAVLAGAGAATLLGLSSATHELRAGPADRPQAGSRTVPSAEMSPATHQPTDPVRWLRVESIPTGALVSLDGDSEQFVTPAVVPYSVGSSALLRFRKEGYRPKERTLTPEEKHGGSIHVQLEPIRTVRVRAEGAYDFEVVIAERVASSASRRHDLSVDAGATVTFRSRGYLLQESMRVEGSDLTYRAPELGGVRLRVADSLMRCEARVAPDGQARRRPLELRLGHPPFDEALSLVPGRYELSFSCPDSPRSASRTFTIMSGQVETLRVLARLQ